MADGRLDQLHRVAVQRIGLAVELDEPDVAGQHKIAGDSVLQLGSQRASFFCKPAHAIRPLQVGVASVSQQMLQLSILHLVERATLRGLDKIGHFPAFTEEAVREAVDADSINHLEWTLDPVVAELHRIVDSNERFVDVGHQFGRIAERVRQDPPGIPPVPVVGIEQ